MSGSAVRSNGQAQSWPQARHEAYDAHHIAGSQIERAWLQMRIIVGQTIRLASFAYAAGWLVWFLVRDQAMRACFPGQDVIAPFPGDPGSRCQELVGQVPYFLIVIALVLGAAIASSRQARSSRRRP